MSMPAPENPGHDDAQPPPTGDAGRPEWLVGMGEEMVSPATQRTAPPTLKAVPLRRPVQPVVPAAAQTETPSSPAPAAPRIVAVPAVRAVENRPAAAPSVEATATAGDSDLSVDPTSLAGSVTAGAFDKGQADAELGLESSSAVFDEAPAAVAPRDPSPVLVETPSQTIPWTAAASSVPSLRKTRRRTIPDETSSGEESWEASEITPPRPSPAPAVTPEQAPPEEFVAEAPREAPQNPFPRRIVPSRRTSTLPKLPKAVLIGIGAVIVLVPIILWALNPKEHFTSVRNVQAHAQQLDGQVVHLKGRVGQTFPVGGGYAYYLHQGRDTIVVFTRGRTPVERQSIKLFGTVSTGYLDGVPHAAVFESDPAVN